jgi:hypothetical protein
MRYLGNGGVYPIYMCNWQRREAIATRDCLHVRCDRLDAAVSEAVLNVLKPAQMKLAVAALEELQSRDCYVRRYRRSNPPFLPEYFQGLRRLHLPGSPGRAL